jgi:succinate dehydrogenase / fumarate reductase cytochrome b subunit
MRGPGTQRPEPITLMRRSPVFSSSVGGKIILALSGAALFVYLLIHLAGNLIVFMGRERFNAYAHLMMQNPLLVPIELALLAVFLVHIWKAVTMTIKNYQARPVKYHTKKMAGYPSRKSAASSTMIWTGSFILLFVIVHLNDIRWGMHYEVEGSDHVRDLYRTEIQVFSDPLKVAFYVVSMIVLGFHLWHGFWSATQSLGVDHPKRSWAILRAGKVIAVVLAGGFLLIPVWAYFFAQNTGVRP